jgi:hypothetical protein
MTVSAGERTPRVRALADCRTGREVALTYRPMPSTEPFLVRVPTGTMYLVEDEKKRVVRSGLLAAALEQSLGASRDVADDDLRRWADGDPVEVLELPKQPAFVVVGGKRRPLRGLPAARPVDAGELGSIPEGPQLDIAAANVSRVRYQQVIASRRNDGAGDVIDRGARLLRRVARKLKRELRRLRS